MPATDEGRPLTPAWWVAATLVFCLLATLNAGGYRFGVADQAFYLPAIQRHLDPASFPRDRLIIDDQDRLNVFTAVVAAGVRQTSIPVHVWFALTYAASLVLLCGGILAIGRALGFSRWAMLAAAAALTLRHRVGMTGANTLESYGHPRLLAFAVGLWAVHALLRGRTWQAIGLVGAAFIVHPTTALWFGLWVGVGALVADRRWRLWLTAGAAAAAVMAGWAITAGPLGAQLVTMDPEWRGVIGAKDYLFTHTWPASAWLTALAYVAAVAAPFAWRYRRGGTAEREPAYVAGLGALLAVFLLSLPATAAGLALAVQFQVSRVFWMFDVAGTVYVAGLIADGVRTNHGLRLQTSRARYTAIVLILAAVARGGFVKWIEHPERPVARWTLPADPWHDACAWLARTPVDTLVLAHPSHAWRYGTSLRVAAGRDVVLEEVKDTAMSMYSRRVAMHVLERIRAIGDFEQATTDDVRALAARYGIPYLVDERPFDLPVAYRNSRFTVYRLAGGVDSRQ